METKNKNYSTISELQNYLDESKLLFDYIIEEIKKPMKPFSDYVKIDSPVFYKVEINPETKRLIEKETTYYDIEVFEEYFEKENFLLGQKFHIIGNNRIYGEVFYKVYSLYFTDKWFLIYKSFQYRQYQYRIFEFENEYYLKNLKFSDITKALCFETGNEILPRLYLHNTTPEEIIGFFNSENEDNFCRTIPKINVREEQAEELYNGIVCMGLPIGLSLRETTKGQVYVNKIHKKILKRLNKISQEKQQKQIEYQFELINKIIAFQNNFYEMDLDN